MKPEDFEVGRLVCLTYECNGSAFRDDKFAVIGHTVEDVLLEIVLFGRKTELTVHPRLLRYVDEVDRDL